MLTESKFYEATHMLPSTNPDRSVRSLFSAGKKTGEKVPAPLRYGLQNEYNVKKLFIHKTVEDQGLFISDGHVFIGIGIY